MSRLSKSGLTLMISAVYVVAQGIYNAMVTGGTEAWETIYWTSSVLMTVGIVMFLWKEERHEDSDRD